MKVFFKQIIALLVLLTMIVASLLVTNEIVNSTRVNFEQSTVVASIPTVPRETIVSENSIVYNFHEEVDKKSADKIIKVLDSAVAGDQILIDLYTPGGNVYEGLRILESMDKSKAKIFIRVRAAASFGFIMAAHIVLSTGDPNRLIVSDNSRLMAHLPSSGGVKLIPGFVKDPDEAQWLKTFLEVLQPYHNLLLTNEQQGAMLRGEDVWLTGVDVKEALRHHFGSKYNGGI